MSTAWEEKFPSDHPSAREDAALCFDATRHEVVLFGGDYSYQPPASLPITVTFNDTWTWDGVNWTEESPSTVPDVELFAQMVYDTVRNEVVLFGLKMDPITSDWVGRTWIWDGTDWTHRASAHLPSFATRLFFSLVFDQAHGYAIFLGSGSDSGSGQWHWDGTDWTQMFVPQTIVAGSPVPAGSLQGHDFPAMLAYDEGRNEVVAWGGRTSPFVYNDTHVWSGTAWVEKFPAESPPPNWGSAFCYCPAIDQLVLFSGGETSYETWGWDGTNWTNLAPIVQPPERLGYLNLQLAIDPLVGQVVLFGGVDYIGVLSDPDYPYATGPHVFDDTWVYPVGVRAEGEIRVWLANFHGRGDGPAP